MIFSCLQGTLWTYAPSLLPLPLDTWLPYAKVKGTQMAAPVMSIPWLILIRNLTHPDLTLFISPLRFWLEMEGAGQSSGALNYEVEDLNCHSDSSNLLLVCEVRIQFLPSSPQEGLKVTD